MPYQFAHHGGGGGGRGLVALVILLLIIGAVIWVVTALIRERDHRHRLTHGSGPHPGAPMPSGSEAMRILDERFARGEIDADDYQQRRDLLRSHT